MSFIFPAMVMRLYGGRHFGGRVKTAYEACAAVLMVLGLGIMGKAVIPPIWYALSRWSSGS